MHGRIKLFWIGLAVIAFAGGCNPFWPEPEPEAPDSAVAEIVKLGTKFDASTTGTIRGKVTWQGNLPEIPKHIAYQAKMLFQPPWTVNSKEFSDPHIPRISEPHKAMADVVVYLRNVDPKKSKPWTLPPVRVELSESKIDVIQGDKHKRTAFVRKGENITFDSREDRYHVARAEGAAFFSLPLPKPNQPRTRLLNQTGRVELTNGAGYYWTRGHIFVTEHPYIVHTNKQGEFVLDQVPPGRYELVVWVPNWHIARREYDTESLVTSRLYYCDPVEVTQTLTITEKQSANVNINISKDMFGK